MFVGDTPIPLPNITASILTQVSYEFIGFSVNKLMFFYQIVEFCNHHKSDPKPETTDDDDDEDPNKDMYEPKKYEFLCFLFTK